MLKVNNLNLVLDNKEILKDVSFEMNPGEILSIIGPSGCGKSSILKSIVGIHKSVTGIVELDHIDITHTPINKRNVTLVFQEYALFPHMTIRENMEVATTDDRLVTNILKEFHLLKHYDKYPYQMSGGEQQRAALARAIAYKPKLLLLDEPFSNVDAITTKTMRYVVYNLLKTYEISTLMVTHDLEDVYRMSERCIVVEDGAISQTGSLEDLRLYPGSSFTSQLFMDIVEYNDGFYKRVK
jgi:ABC-type Fe3+/spermidine/putrescine transport system ATPase subunit